MDKIRKSLNNFSFAGGLYDIYQKALKLEEEGKKIIHMEIGKPDFDSPIGAKRVTIKALEEGKVHYTPMNGIPELRKAITNYYSENYNLNYSYDNEIVVCAGACEAITAIFLTVLEEGDDILVPSPFFSAYSEQAMIAGINVVEVPLKYENSFKLTLEDIEENITPKTKMIIINTPHNPTGSVFEKQDLDLIAEYCIKNDLLVLSDETYDRYIYEGTHYSIASYKGMRERTFIVNSASKTFSMTGWRVGYVLGRKDYLKYTNKVHQNLSTCATSFAQYGVAHAYNNELEFTTKMLAEFKRRRDLLIEGLKSIDGFKIIEPKGAFYLFANIEEFGMSELDFCNYILDEALVAIVPGHSFGSSLKGYVRICYTCSYEDIENAIKQIKNAVLKIKKVGENEK